MKGSDSILDFVEAESWETAMLHDPILVAAPREELEHPAYNLFANKRLMAFLKGRFPDGYEWYCAGYGNFAGVKRGLRIMGPVFLAQGVKYPYWMVWEWPDGDGIVLKYAYNEDFWAYELFKANRRKGKQ